MLNKHQTLFLISFFALNFQISVAATQPKTEVSLPAKLTLTIDQYSEVVPYETYSLWLNHKSSITKNLAYKSEFENQNFCPTQSKIICNMLFSQKITAHFQGKSSLIFNQEAAKAFLDDLARRTDFEATDAKFKVEDGSLATFTPEKDGVRLDREKALTLVSDFAKNNQAINSDQTINLPYKKTSPSVTTEEINNMGIKTLIGEGKSNFKGSPVNRIKNIKVAASRFNGVLIKPGEEFSFVKVLGEVDAEHGYFPELVIKKGVTEPEFGGGVCQVSTTAFRAAIYSGLEITARRNHAYPVSYYNPQGMDSTVYVPQPDLRFKNNTPGYILMQTKITGTELVFDFYGTDDGRKITVDGPTITERQPDGALKATFTQHVFDKDGKEFISDVFNSSYASPYKYPHPGGPILSAKPSNWSDEEWKTYKNTLKDMAKAAADAAKKASKP